MSHAIPYATARDNWTAHMVHRSGSEASTARIYRRHVDPALQWIGIPYQDITLIELSNYLAHLESRWAANSRRVAAVALRAFFKFARSCRWIPDNPAEGLGIPPGERREIRTLSVKQVQKVIGDEPWTLSAMELRNRLIFGLSYHLGLRAHEVTWLRWDQLESTNDNTLTVALKASKHSRKELRREIRNTNLSTMLAYYVTQYRQDADDSPWLFPSRQADRHGPAGRLSTRQIQRIFFALLRGAGIRIKPGYRHHMLRASITTHLLEAGHNFHEVQQCLRHADGKTTLLYVEHVNERRLGARLFSLATLGPREKEDWRRAFEQDVGLSEPRNRGSGRFPH